ncbi:YxiJ-like family protein [Bacillus bingmayongensis]|uniref:YxiJ-like family protein n=1 Tax=Bacillus bingmayongensis TaxID=1150157 RepID=UPI001C8DFC6B|nr:YxiJ-like family protein [Bacillus bingmayongensis]MBY0599417.1 YxiJ-like family protein [Bacillus bingmayongensis]
MILGKKVIFEELQKLHDSLHQPFPYRDVRKMRKDFKEKFDESDCLSADLNIYWMNIARTLSYVLNGKIEKIPLHQIQLLRVSFFERFKQFCFLEKHIENYLLFYRDYMYYEKARKLLLYYLAE